MIRVLYAGSPEASASALKKLIEKSPACGFEIAGVLTNAPSAQGRHRTPVRTPVANVAADNGIPVFEPEHLDADARSSVSAVHPDILVCFAYGHIFGPKFMSVFKFGGINLHPSALPKYRGCTPVNAAILNRDSMTAFTIQKVSERMDEGNILAQKPVALDGTETAGFLLEKAADCGADLLCSVLENLYKTGVMPDGAEQEGAPSYTGMILKSDARINWKNSSSEVDAAVRAYFPEPCAWTQENGAPLRILEGCAVASDNAAVTEEMRSDAVVPGTVCAFVKNAGIIVKCADGFFAVKKLQRQGKNAVDFKAFMNGAHDFIGTVLE